MDTRTLYNRNNQLNVFATTGRPREWSATQSLLLRGGRGGRKEGPRRGTSKTNIEAGRAPQLRSRGTALATVGRVFTGELWSTRLSLNVHRPFGIRFQ